MPEAAAAALGIRAEPRALDALPAAGAALEPWSAQVEAWQCIQLLPGLQLMLGPNASPAASRAASKICSDYLG